MNIDLQMPIRDLKTYRAILHWRLSQLERAIAILEEAAPPKSKTDMAVEPVRESELVTVSHPVPTDPSPEEPVRSDQTPAPRGGQRPGKAFSKYKGVTRLSPLKDGSLRFRASIWREGKNRPLGNFVGEHAEREAALAAARARGDTGLIAELEADLEQAENNPDKTDWVWQCNRCGHDHPQLDRPDHCQRCKHTGMRRFEKGKRNLPEGN